MTELEEKFYKIMGIEPKEYKDCTWDSDCPYPTCKCDNCPNYKVAETAYPPITDHILLELICIINSISYIKGRLIVSKDIDTLKKEILLDCLVHTKDIKSDVRKLFEEK